MKKIISILSTIKDLLPVKEAYESQNLERLKVLASNPKFMDWCNDLFTVREIDLPTLKNLDRLSTLVSLGKKYNSSLFQSGIIYMPKGEEMPIMERYKAVFPVVWPEVDASVEDKDRFFFQVRWIKGKVPELREVVGLVESLSYGNGGVLPSSPTNNFKQAVADQKGVRLFLHKKNGEVFINVVSAHIWRYLMDNFHLPSVDKSSENYQMGKANDGSFALMTDILCWTRQKPTYWLAGYQ